MKIIFCFLIFFIQHYINIARFIHIAACLSSLLHLVNTQYFINIHHTLPVHSARLPLILHFSKWCHERVSLNYILRIGYIIKYCCVNIFTNFSDLWILDVTAAAAAKSLQLCPTLCDPIVGSQPGSPVPGILQARTLEWVAISFSNAWKWKVKMKSLSHVRLLATPWTTA